jgi:hypothetical protein
MTFLAELAHDVAHELRRRAPRGDDQFGVVEELRLDHRLDVVDHLLKVQAAALVVVRHVVADAVALLEVTERRHDLGPAGAARCAVEGPVLHR